MRLRSHKVAAVYALAGGAWIVGTDWLAATLGPGAQPAQLVKGLVFVAATALILWWLLRRWESQIDTARTDLGRTRRLFKTLFQRLDDAVIIVNRDREIVDCNAAVEHVLGYAPAALIGQRTELIHLDRETFAEFGARSEQALRRHGIFRTEYQLRHRDGHVIYTEHIVAFTDDERETAISVIRDISEKKRKERLIAQQSAYLQSLLRHISDVVAVVDREDRLEFVSSSVTQVLGLSVDQAQGKPVLDLVHPEDHDLVRSVLARARERPGTAHRVEHRALTGDGSWTEAESVGTTIDGDAIGGTVVCTRDVSEQRATERALRDKDAQLLQAQKMEAIGRLAGSVAHDINNILTVIFAAGSFVSEQLEDGSEAREDMQQLVEAAGRAAKLTEQLLLFSRQQVVEPRRTDLNATVQRMEAVLGRLIGEDVTLQAHYDTQVPRVLVDDNQIAQVFMNLAVNARDAMPEGGQLDISTRAVELGTTQAAHKRCRPGRYAVVEVRDTGEGMDAATQARIFEPFFTTKKAGQGTGLGLSTSFGIVASAGGFIEVESQPGRGSCFRVYLPEFVGETPSKPASDRVPRAGRGESILLVEDDPRVRVATSRLLQRAGYRVTEAAGPTEALAQAALVRPDLLVTDVVMPGGTGRELAAKLVQRGLCSRVLFISGYTPDELLRRRVAEEGAMLLRKPFTEANLRLRVRDALEQDEEAVRAHFSEGD